MGAVPHPQGEGLVQVQVQVQEEAAQPLCVTNVVSSVVQVDDQLPYLVAA